MPALPVVISIALACFGAVTIVGNWETVIRWILFRKSGSTVPFLGGVCIALAVFICPLDSIGGLW
jgi:hypothetical protein